MNEPSLTALEMLFVFLGIFVPIVGPIAIWTVANHPEDEP
jgi:uncharacterized Tic20 family protein